MTKSIRFIGVGLISTLSYFVFSWSLIAAFKLDIKITNVAAYVMSMGLSYMGHRHVTFRSRGNITQEAWRFAVTHIVNLILSTALLICLVDLLNINRYVATALAGALMMTCSFIILQIWVFRHREVGD